MEVRIFDAINSKTWETPLSSLAEVSKYGRFSEDAKDSPSSFVTTRWLTMSILFAIITFMVDSDAFLVISSIHVDTVSKL